MGETAFSDPDLCICVSSTSLTNQSRVRDVGIGTTLPFEQQALVEWINDFRRDGAPISATMLKLKALDMAQEAGIPDDHFSASWQWRKGFTKRHRLSFRAKTHQGQITPAGAAQRAARFAKDVRRRAATENILRIYNADQTGVFF